MKCSRCDKETYVLHAEPGELVCTGCKAIGVLSESRVVLPRYRVFHAYKQVNEAENVFQLAAILGNFKRLGYSNITWERIGLYV